MQLFVLCAGVADSVRSQQRESQPPGQRDEPLVVMFFLADEMALQLDMRPPFEDAADLLHRLVIGARQAVQPFHVLLDQLPIAEPEQEPQVIDVLLGAPCGHRLALPVHRRQLQGLQVVLQQDRAPGLVLAHGATPAVRESARRT